jgi:hypothetical protein
MPVTTELFEMLRDYSGVTVAVLTVAAHAVQISTPLEDGETVASASYIQRVENRIKATLYYYDESVVNEVLLLNSVIYPFLNAPYTSFHSFVVNARLTREVPAVECFDDF